MVGVLVGAGGVLALLQFVLRIELGNVWRTYHRGSGWCDCRNCQFAGAAVHHGVTALAFFHSRNPPLPWDWTATVDDRNGTAGIVAVGSRGWDWHLASIFAGAAPAGADLLSADFSAESCARCGGKRMSLHMIVFLYLAARSGHLGFLVNTANAYGQPPDLILATEANDVALPPAGTRCGRNVAKPDQPCAIRGKVPSARWPSR